MLHRDTRVLYPESCYDHDLCLKPPLLLWIGILFLSRALALPPAMGLAHFIAGADANVSAVMRSLWRPDTLISSIPAAPLLYAFFRRIPTASRAVRWIWAHGRVILAVAAGTDIVLSAIQLYAVPQNDGELFSTVCAITIDAFLLLYVLAARRVRDVFLDFPLDVKAGGEQPFDLSHLMDGDD